MTRKPQISRGTKLDFEAPDLYGSIARENVADLLRAAGDHEKADTLLDRSISETGLQKVDRDDPRWRELVFAKAEVARAQGNSEEAIGYILEDLGQPLGYHLDWQPKYRHTVWMRPFLEDGRVVRRVDELDTKAQNAAAEILAMLVEMGN